MRILCFVGLFCAVFTAFIYSKVVRITDEKDRQTNHVRSISREDTSAQSVAQRYPSIYQQGSTELYNEEQLRLRLQHTMSIADKTTRIKQLIELYKFWITHNPNDAINFILQQDKNHSELFLIALPLWADIDIVAFNAWLTSVTPHDHYDEAVAAIIEKTTATESKTINWAMRINQLHIQDEAITRLIKRWVKTDPRQAIQWSLSASGNDQIYTVETFDALASINPERAISSLFVLQNSDESVIQAIGESIKRHLKPEQLSYEMVSHIQSLPIDGFQQKILEILLPTIVKGVPSDEVMMLINALPNGSSRDAMQQHLAYLWADKDPTTAAKFAEYLPDGNLRAETIKNIISPWASNDLKAASKWLQSVDGNIDEAALTLTIKAIKYAADPALAKLWVKNINDQELQIEAVLILTGSWYELDPEAASAYLREQAVFNAADTKKYLSHLAVSQKEIVGTL